MWLWRGGAPRRPGIMWLSDFAVMIYESANASPFDREELDALIKQIKRINLAPPNPRLRRLLRQGFGGRALLSREPLGSWRLLDAFSKRRNHPSR